MITVFTKPDCIQCDRTRAQLTKHGLAFTTRDVTTDPEAYGYITAELGYQQAPVVVIDDGQQHWSGFRPDKIAQLAASHRAREASTTTQGPTIAKAHFTR